MASLAALRRRALLSQRDLARRAGVAPSSVYLIEHGRTRPRGTVIRKLAMALGVSDPMQVDEFRHAVTQEHASGENRSPGPQDQVDDVEAVILDAQTDPVLADLWDNEEDAVYDHLALAADHRASA